MIKFSIELDQSALQKFILEANNVERTLKSGLRKAMLFAEAKSKASFGQTGKPKVVTGRLRSSITSGVESGLIGWLGTNVVYAPSHEFGAIIRPKRGQYLKFQIQGQWRTVRQVVIPKRAFLAPAIEDSRDEMIDIIAKELLEAFGE